MTLPGSQAHELQDALEAVFDQSSLERMVDFHLDQRLEVVAGGDNLSEQIYNLICWAKRTGHIDDLIAAAVDDNPDNPELRAFANLYCQSAVQAERFDSLPVCPSTDAHTILQAIEASLWQLPPPPSCFVGREAELVAYNETLERTRWLMIKGMAGVGKTTLGAQLARMQQLGSDQIFWFVFNSVDANTADAMYWAVAAFLEKQGKPDLMKYLRGETQTPSILDKTSKLRLFVTTLGAAPYLLCFDCYETVKDVSEIAYFFEQLLHRYVIQQQPLPARFILMGREFSRDIENVLLDEDKLDGFDEQDAIALMAARGLQLPLEVGKHLWARTEGNPMLLLLSTSVLQHMAHDEKRIETFLETMGSSPDIRDYLMNNVYSALPSSERIVFDVMSVLSSPVSREAVEAVLEGEGIAHGVQLVDRAAIHPFVSDDAGQLTCHSLILEYCYRVLDESERLRHHRQAAEVFEHLAKFLEAVHHYLRCGSYSRALDMLTTNARDIIDNGGAEALLAKLEQLSQLPLEAKQRLALETTSAKAYHMRGQYEQALHAYISGLDATRDELDRADILREIGLVYRDWGQLDLALLHLDQSLAICVRCHDGARTTEAHYCLGRTYYRQAQFAQSRQHLEQAHTLSIELGDQLLRAKAEFGLGTLDWREGNLRDAQARLEESRRIFHVYGDRPREARSVGNLGRIYGELGDRQRELAAYEEIRSVQEEIGDIYSLLITYNNLGDLYQLLGNYRQAADYYHQLSCLAQDVRHTSLLCTAYAGMGDAYLAMDNPQEALRYASEAESICQELGACVELGICLRLLGDIWCALGDSDLALSYYDRCLPLLEDAHEDEEVTKARRGREALHISGV